MTLCLRWNQPHAGNVSASSTYPYPDRLPCAQEGLVIEDYCRHDDIDLDTNEDYHVISCNQCGRWWRCYGDMQDVWGYFLKFSRMDGSDPPTVNIVGSLKEWPTSDKKMVQAT